MHPTQRSGFLGNFSRNIPEAAFGIAGDNFNYKTKEMTGRTMKNVTPFP